uniref:Uncharacterized protein n=1 Tax=Aegilops tauschii subsp. strangulata TaxID=200361 RepID=A0A453FGA6_AEGTS
MLLYHRILPRLLSLSLPSSPTSKLLIRPSRLPPRGPFLPRCAALSQLAAPQTVDHSDGAAGGAGKAPPRPALPATGGERDPGGRGGRDRAGPQGLQHRAGHVRAGRCAGG